MNPDIIREIIGAIFLIFGVVFSALGVIGVIRLPDTYSRLHASGKTSILGVVSICIGAALLMPAGALKLIALSAFMIFTGPVVSHSIAAAVHRLAAIRRLENPEEVTASGIHDIAAIQEQVRRAQKSVLDSTESEMEIPDRDDS